MRLRIGNNRFDNVTIPVLWGPRAVVQDKKGRLSVINLGGREAVLEIVGDEVAPGVKFKLNIGAFVVLDEAGKDLYSYAPDQKLLVALSTSLPELQVEAHRLRIGSNVFQANMVSGSPVGIIVDEQGIGIGAPLPPGLARLVI